MPRIAAATLEQHVKQQREKILDAAFDLFRTRGPDGVELTDIAAACGLARNSLYKYFPDKDHIMFACVMRNFEAVMAANAQALRGLADPVTRIDEWMKQVLRFITGPSHEMVEMLYRIPLLKHELRSAILQASAPVLACLRESFSEILRDSGRDVDLSMAMVDGMTRAAGHHAKRTGNVDQVCGQLRTGVRAILRDRSRIKPSSPNRAAQLSAI